MQNKQKYLQVAIDIAAKHHHNVWRKGGRNGIKLPYLHHPLDVMKRAWKWGINKPSHYVELSTYVLHDVLEDPNSAGKLMNHAQLRDYLREVPERNKIVDHVIELTHEESVSKAVYMTTFQSKSLVALIGKVADRFCNVEDWLMVDPAYAEKYYHKANFLWGALLARRQEIADHYGPSVADAIDVDLSILTRDIPPYVRA